MIRVASSAAVWWVALQSYIEINRCAHKSFEHFEVLRFGPLGVKRVCHAARCGHVHARGRWPAAALPCHPALLRCSRLCRLQPERPALGRNSCSNDHRRVVSFCLLRTYNDDRSPLYAYARPSVCRTCAVAKLSCLLSTTKPSWTCCGPSCCRRLIPSHCQIVGHMSPVIICPDAMPPPRNRPRLGKPRRDSEPSRTTCGRLQFAWPRA